VNELPPRPASALPRIRILVVEENGRLLHALLRFLATEPAVVVVGSAGSPDEAIIQAARLEPELVLIDGSLPRAAVAQACWLMRVRPAPPKIVALLNDDEEAYRASAGAIGADAVIGKARLSEALLPLLRELFPARPAEK
jgi:two-component system nitrate/nitrite response regulator NarL